MIRNLRPAILTFLLLTLIPLAVFGPSCRSSFVSWDDDLHLYENPLLNPVTAAHVGKFWTAPYDRLYIPLTYTVWSGIAAVSPRTPAAPLPAWPFHAANVVLHALNTVLVFLILKKLSAIDVAAIFGALLFALHPVQVEPVAWASGLRDLLSASFGLLAILDYRRTLWRAALFFLCALLCKPSAVAVPFMIAVLDIGVFETPWRQSLKRLAPWFALALAWTALTRSMQPAAEMSFIPPWSDRPWIAGGSILFYLTSLTGLTPYVPDYGLTPKRLLLDPWNAAAWPILAALLYLLWKRDGRRLWLSSLFLFLAALIPVLGFVPFNFQNTSTVADRYLYLAMLGPALAVTPLIRRINAGWIILLLLFAGRSTFQLTHWKDSESLYRHTLQINPRSALAHNNLGNLYFDRGDAPQAIRAYRNAIDAAPQSAEPRHNLALVLGSLNRLPEAVALLRQATRLDPRFEKAQYHLGVLLLAQGKPSEAIPPLHQAVLLNPANQDAARHLAHALRRMR